MEARSLAAPGQHEAGRITMDTKMRRPAANPKKDCNALLVFTCVCNQPKKQIIIIIIQNNNNNK